MHSPARGRKSSKMHLKRSAEALWRSVSVWCRHSHALLTIRQGRFLCSAFLPAPHLLLKPVKDGLIRLRNAPHGNGWALASLPGSAGVAGRLCVGWRKEGRMEAAEREVGGRSGEGGRFRGRRRTSSASPLSQVMEMFPGWRKMGEVLSTYAPSGGARMGEK